MIRLQIERWLNKTWYEHPPWYRLLLPLSWLYCLVATLRRHLLCRNPARRAGLAAKIVVVGNLNAGGTGKTPLVMALAGRLHQKGIRTGIVTRGYGGRAKRWPQLVHAGCDPELVGDEAVLLATTGLPVVAGPDRVQAVLALLDHTPVDAIISDDGLQHYRMPRDLEICVIDASRGLGNGHCLPAGPLREPASRLETIDMVVHLGKPQAPYWMRLRPGKVCRVGTGDHEQLLQEFRGQRVHAVAAIGNPGRFFELLRQEDIEILPHVFCDHYSFRPRDLAFGDDLPVLMTAKDAVKCAVFAEPHWWFVTLDPELAPAIETRVLQLFPGRHNRTPSFGQETA